MAATTHRPRSDLDGGWGVSGMRDLRDLRATVGRHSTPSARMAVAAGVSGVGAAGATWEVARRRAAARLEADPDHDILDAPLPGEPFTVTSRDGTVLHGRVAGPEGAPTVVLVHGWGMAMRYWIHQLRELSTDHRVVVYDLRGHGISDRAADGDYSFEAFGADLAAVLAAQVRDDAVAAGALPVIAGHSLGAMTVMAWAQNGTGPVSSRAAGVVLFDTAVTTRVAAEFALLGVAKQVMSAAGRHAMRVRIPIPRRTAPLSSAVIRRISLSASASPVAVAVTEQLFLDVPASIRSAVATTLAAFDLGEALPASTSRRWSSPDPRTA